MGFWIGLLIGLLEEVMRELEVVEFADVKF